mmetsp:Transcript_62464/g.136688  ORF Transcript_62464/g.136688 Transcript_62464/m.136688 type:complete len:221 (+) Transcript_62464:580-1242(+)
MASSRCTTHRARSGGLGVQIASAHRDDGPFSQRHWPERHFCDGESFPEEASATAEMVGPVDEWLERRGDRSVDSQFAVLSSAHPTGVEPQPHRRRPGPRGSAFGAPAPGASLAAWQRAGRKGRRQSLPGPGGECPQRRPFVGPGPGVEPVGRQRRSDGPGRGATDLGDTLPSGSELQQLGPSQLPDHRRWLERQPLPLRFAHCGQCSHDGCRRLLNTSDR